MMACSPGEKAYMSTTIIQVKNVSKHYGAIKALADVSFEVREGDIVGYVGPNGSGKTTTLKIITGLCRPDTGAVRICNESIADDYAKVGRKVAVIFEEPSDYERMTTWENLEFYARLSNMPRAKRQKRIQQSLEEISLIDRKADLVKTLSKGMKRKLAVARALLAEPQVLVLDEPFDGIDVASRMNILSYVKKWVQQSGHSVLLTSHNMYEIEAVCNEVVILKRGRILASGSLERLRQCTDEYDVEVSLQQRVDDIRLKEVLSNCGILPYKLKAQNLLLSTGGRDLSSVSAYLHANGIEFEGIRRRYENLNEIYMRVVGDHE